MLFNIKDVKEIFDGYIELDEKLIFPTGYDCYITDINLDINNLQITFADPYAFKTYQITLTDVVIVNLNIGTSYKTSRIFSMGIFYDDESDEEDKLLFSINGEKFNLECGFTKAQIKQVDDDDYKLRFFIEATENNLQDYKNEY